MISKGLLYESLANITLIDKKLQEKVKCTRLDLSEDFLLSSPVADVLAMLDNCTYPYGKCSETKQTDDEEVSTVYIYFPSQETRF